MKNFLNKVLVFVRKFPLVSCGGFVAVFLFVLGVTDSIETFEVMAPGLPLVLAFLNYTFQLIERCADFIGFGWLTNLFNSPLVGTCIFLFLLDLLILYLRKHLIPAIRSKNRNLLIPSFLKVLSKSLNGKS